MAKKSSIKVRLVPEAKPDSSFFYYAKKPTKGEKVKVKLKVKKGDKVNVEFDIVGKYLNNIYN